MLRLLFFYLGALEGIVRVSGYPANQVPYTLYQLPLQANFVKNQHAVGDSVYEPFFRPDLFVYPEMIEPGRTPINCSTQAMQSNFSDINTLLAPASTILPKENAWCAYSDGQGYVASRTHWPDVTAQQISWWFWWHSAHSIRYSLWHPWAHVSVNSSFVDKFNDTRLNDTEKLIGSVHQITEIIGEVSQDIDIHWQRPSYFGLDESRFEENGIVASACGEVYVSHNLPLKAVDMIHLWYQTSTGLELRSRYFLASNVQLKIPILGSLLPIDTIANWLGIKNAIVGPELSYLQFHHDQQEMTHLAAILPEIHAAFYNTTI